MSSIAALILADSDAESFAGLGLTERAVLTLSRAGITDIHVVGTVLPDTTQARLHARGLAVTCTAPAERPFLSAPDADALIVLSSRTIAEPKAIRALIGNRPLERGQAALAVVPHGTANASGGASASTDKHDWRSQNLAALTRDAVAYVRTAPNFRQAIHRLAAADCLKAATVAPGFIARLRDGASRSLIERDYFRPSNGGDGEGLFTRNIRRFSVPLSQQLVKLPISANHVTIAGLVLSIGAGVSFALGGYWFGLLGATLYFVSMILDCSDGEVARAKFGDSNFGAWLETVTDYLSYFLVLGGIVWADYHAEGLCKHTIAALVGVAGTVVLVLSIGYLRARIAAANPGAFDDALAADLKRGTLIQRFAGWGRQFIKRSFLAHLFLFQALLGQVPALTEMWAFGAVCGVALLVAVQARLIRRVRVGPPLQPSLTLSYTEN